MGNYLSARSVGGVLAVLLLCAPTLAIAGIRDDMAVCAAIENSVKRLDCFDKAADEHGLTAQSESVESPGKWSTNKTTSPVDDTETVVLWLSSDEPVGFGKYKTVKPTLIVRCKENKTVIYINYSAFLGSDEGYLTYRIDKGTAQRVEWGISTNHYSIGLWSGNGSIPFIKKLFGKKQLLTRVEPYSESPVTTTFHIAGLEEAIKPLRKACYW